MKTKKRYMVIASIMLALVMAFSISSYAATATFGLDEYRKPREEENGKQYAYQMLDKKIWKIVQYNGADKIYDRSIYCLKAEQGFFSETGDFLKPVEYNLSYNLKDKESMKRGLPIGEDIYNQVLWILDSSYIPSSTTAKEDRQALLTAAGIPTDNTLTDDDIDVVQQLAIWYYTNRENTIYHTNDVGGPVLAALHTSSKLNNIKTAYDNLPQDRQDDAKKLYQYLIKIAEDNKDKEVTQQAPISLSDEKDPLIEETTDQYILGPYKINKNNDKAYTFTTSLQNEKKEEIKNYTLLDENKAVVAQGTTTQDLVGAEFYLSIPKTEIAKSYEFSITGSFTNSTMTYWTNGSAIETTQPLVVIEKVPGEIKGSKLVSIKDFDLSLRKFISKVGEQEIDRAPRVDTSKLNTMIDGKKTTTAIYNHPKTSLAVKNGDTIIYTIRVYNEGDIDGFASEITDYLPPELEFINDEFNAEYGWKLDSNNTRKITTNKLAYSSNAADADRNTENIIKAFDGTTLSYKDLKVKCRLKTNIKSKQQITNIAEITNYTDGVGGIATDRDSTANNIALPTDEQLPTYQETQIANGDSYIPGQQDDDDFEKLIIEEYDLSLRKFISELNGTNIIGRQPQVDITKLASGESTTAIYRHPKKALNVERNNVITYTIRVYNEGDIDGFANSITDQLPEELEYVLDDPTNQKYGWSVSEDGRTLTTDYLSKAKNEENVIKAFDGTTLAYKDIQVVCKVKQTASLGKKITNLAQISGNTDKEGSDVADRDSQTNNMQYPTDEKLPQYKEDEINEGKEYIPGQQDDDDFEKVKIAYFDLSLRKFITGVNENKIDNRVPNVTIGEDGSIHYEHTKEPVEVENGNLVTYTMRVYNEGLIDGYASKIVDDIPDGLEFLPNNEVNKMYRWKLSEDEMQVSTDYLSQEQEKTAQANLLKAFNQEQEISDNQTKNPDYRDVKIVFQVTEPSTSDRIIINTAEIAEDADATNQPVDDIDSVPGNNNEWNAEDDLDKEFVKVKYFDLALKKWVSKVILIEDEKEEIRSTGHTGQENPEPIVKVDLNRKNLNKVIVKFEFQIKVTNEGQVAGYAKEITDYVPDGLKFIPEDNTKWYTRENNDKKVATKALEDTLLQPGESSSVPIILTWINGEDNMGLKLNVAEISKDYNSSHTPDIDSTPDNKKAGEDDIDDAPVMLTMVLGQNNIYYGLIAIILVTIAGGICLIKRYVL